MSRGRLRSSCRSLGFLALLIVAGCGTAGQKQGPVGATLVAEPNPVPAGAGRGTTKLSWNIPGRSQGEVYVSIDGAKEVLFAGLASGGNQKADWIDQGSTYEFRLYEGTGHEKVLGSVKVTRDGAKK